MRNSVGPLNQNCNPIVESLQNEVYLSAEIKADFNGDVLEVH